MLRRLGNALLVAIALFAAGCASITGSEIQNIALSTKSEQGKDLAKANCDLKNDKGQWKGVTPGFVSVQRSAEDLLVTCTKEGENDGMLRAISRAASGMFGNILFGGGIGAIIDHNKGTGYDYPEALVVEMGKSLVRDRDDERKEKQQKALEVQPNPTPTR
jgi:hypothetical protein